MRDFGIMIFTLFAFVGICFIVGICTRGTEKNEKDKDHAVMTFMRGLGFVYLLLVLYQLSLQLYI